MQIQNMGLTELTADEAIRIDGGDGGAVVALGTAILATAVAGAKWGYEVLGPWLMGQ